MKRKIVILLVAVLLIGALCTVFAACGGNSGDLKLMVYSPANNDAKTAYEQMILKFTEETGVRVKVRFVPKDEYNSKLKTSFRTDEKPDVFILDQPMLADYESFCLNLNSGFFAEEDEEGLHISDFFDVAMDTVKYKDNILAVPFSLTTSILLYNKSIVTSAPQSWDEWLNISVPSGKALFAGIGSGGYASWYFQAFLKSAGGDMIDSNNNIIFNNDQGVDAATMLKELYKKSPKAIRETANAFVNDKVLFTLAHNADIINMFSSNPSFCESKLGAMLFVPQNEGGTSYSNIGGENLAIYNKSKNIEACKKLVRFLLREENSNKAISSNFSAIKAYAKVREADPITGEVYSDTFKQVMSVVLEQLQYASARPQVKSWMRVNDEYLSAALLDIVDNGKDVRESLNTAQAQAAALIQFD